MITAGVSKKGGELLIETKNQDNRQNLAELYKRYYPKVYHTCLSYVRNPDDAFDLAQDVMLKAFSNIGSFEGKSTFSTWLFSITRNHCISQVAKNRKVYCEDIHVAHGLIAQELNSEELEKREKKEQLELNLQQLLDLLPVNDRQMLEFKYFQNYSIKDLQNEFCLSASAVKMRLLRARQRIEQMLEIKSAA